MPIPNCAIYLSQKVDSCQEKIYLCYHLKAMMMSEGAQGRQKCQWVSLGVKGVNRCRWVSLGVKVVNWC